MAKKKELTPREWEFVRLYVGEGRYNAVKTYKMVYPDCTDKQVNKKAYNLVHRPLVHEAILAEQKKQFDSLAITPERIARELASIAFAEKGDKDYNASAKNKALDLLQKQLGLQVQKVQAEVQEQVIITDDYH